MDIIDQILKQAKNFLICPVCGDQYDSAIKFRGFIDNTYVFQAYCAKGHQPLAVTYLASLHRLEKPIGAYFHQLSGEKVTAQIVDEARKALDDFDGNWNRLWQEE